MKILRVIPTMAPSSGGPAQGIRNSIPSLNALGHHNEVVCLDDPAEDFVKTSAFPIHALGNASGPWGHNRTLLPWLQERAPLYDAVLVHGLWQYHSYAVWRALGESSKTPYFVFPHGMLDPWFQKAKERRLKALRNWFYWKLIERKVIRDASGLLFTCEAELQLARTTFKSYQPKRELNVGYGITEPPAFHERMKAAFTELCADLSERSYFLFLSRIHPKKGVDLLIRAYGELSKQASLTKMPVLVIAGPGVETAYGQELQRLALELCPAGSVIFPGMLTGDSKWGAFYGCEAFVLPSHQENFGISVVEALACSKPVLISDQVNIWREIQNERAGLVASNSLEGTKKLLQQWFKINEPQRRQMNDAAAACYNKYFLVENVVNNLAQAIHVNSSS